jgi:hypothetical protein
MREVERNAYAGDAVGGAPFVAEPGVEPKSMEAGGVELFAQSLDAIL